MDRQSYRKKMKEPHPQFGVTPRRLPGTQLPTNGDVIGRLMMLRVELMEERSKDVRHLPMAECISRVTGEVMDIWERASVPTRQKQHVLNAVKQLWERKNRVKKKSRKRQPKSRDTLTAAAICDIDDLFDISNRAYQPELAQDRDFLADQRGPRRLHIGALDQQTTERWQRREQRAERRARQHESAAVAKSVAGVVELCGDPRDISAAAGSSGPQ